MAYRTKATLRDPSVIEVMNFVTESQQCAVDKKLNSTIKASAAWELSKFLNSPEPQQYFASWSLDNVSDVRELKVTEENIKKASVKRLQEKIEDWEIQIIVFSESRTLLTQNLLWYSKWVKRQNQNVQNSLKADSVASSSSTDPDSHYRSHGSYQGSRRLRCFFIQCSGKWNYGCQRKAG